MTRPVALVTGAGGEVGHGLVPALVAVGLDVVALDLAPLPAALARQCLETAEASIVDDAVMEALFRRHRFAEVYHLAAVLSAKAEREPQLAHRVNVDGTLGIFELARRHRGDAPTRILFPSSIAVYGLPDAATKAAAGAVRETEWTVPRGIYGCNKLYGELLGACLARREDDGRRAFDFRAMRFPGLISAETLPTGGTTDFAPAMLHAAVQGKPYRCFVAPHTRLPFMTMPDAVAAIVALAHAEPSRLSSCAYNVRGFSASADEIRQHVVERFPGADIDFAVEPARQALADGWPADVDDARARSDWGFAPRHDLAAAFDEYLVPALGARYGA